MEMRVRKTGRAMLLGIIAVTLLSWLLMSAFRINGIQYLADPLNVGLLVCVLLSKEKMRLLQAKYLLLAMGVWLGYMLLNGLCKGAPLPLLLWATRNWGRGFVLFGGCLVFLEAEDVRRGLRIADGLFIVNFLLAGVELFVFGEKGDFLGGLFGTQVGCNGNMMVFLVFMLLLTLCRTLEENRITPYRAFVIISSMVLAACSEIKLFFYVYPVCVILVTVVYMLKRQTKRGTVAAVLLLGAAALSLGLLILRGMFPESFDLLIGRRTWAQYEETSRSVYRISRTHFIREINRFFFHDSVPLNVAGYGFGNCEYSRFGFLTSDFYRQNGEMNYLFFSHQTMFLEGGLVGLGLYQCIHLALAAEHLRPLIREKGTAMALAYRVVFALFMVACFFYNCSHRADGSYLIFLGAAVAYFLPLAGRQPAERGKKVKNCSHL